MHQQYQGVGASQINWFEERDLTEKFFPAGAGVDAGTPVGGPDAPQLLALQGDGRVEEGTPRDHLPGKRGPEFFFDPQWKLEGQGSTHPIPLKEPLSPIRRREGPSVS